ncbi:hypothetical protein RBE51_18240 [Pseudomonas taiwanensis]|uniref:hypothetical protein n=1 Tax=Pseudomonas taiwanensis TaxID=470150 RepID=UPI0028DFDD05|nr:hypothetical protein [Pseudomonas taiwanensis]MDT8924736.1 hypothetical protein [Pseudomonas taiwanensis]
MEKPEMKKAYNQSVVDEQRCKLTRLLIGDLSVPAFCYDFKLDRKVLIPVMAGSKPYTDRLWDEVCSKTGLPSEGSQVPKLRTNMERIHLLDEWLGSDSVEHAAARHGVDPSLIYRYFIHAANLDARHARKLAVALQLPENYFEITPLSSIAPIKQSTYDYSHRHPPGGIDKDLLKNRSNKLKALIGHHNIHEFCRAFNLDSRLIHAVLFDGTQMNRMLCRDVTHALSLQSDFFDKPICDLDHLEILSVQDELKRWPLTEQLRILRQKALAHLARLTHYR